MLFCFAAPKMREASGPFTREQAGKHPQMAGNSLVWDKSSSAGAVFHGGLLLASLWEGDVAAGEMLSLSTV